MTRIQRYILAALLTLAAAFALPDLTGCKGRDLSNWIKTARPTTVPQTRFDVPTTVPSVTPPVDRAITSNDHATDAARQAYTTAADAQMIAAQKQALLGILNTGLGYLAATRDALSDAKASATANDSAVRVLTDRLLGTQKIVGEREQQIKDMADADAKALAALQTKLDTATSAATLKDRQTARLIAGVTASGGVLLILAGGLTLYFVTPKTLGVVLSGFGGLCVCIGWAGLYFGREIAIAGFGVVVVSLLGGMWAGFHYLRKDGESLGEAFQHLIHLPGDVSNTQIVKTLEHTATTGGKRILAAVAPSAVHAA
jgi:hypothetical protein